MIIGSERVISLLLFWQGLLVCVSSQLNLASRSYRPGRRWSIINAWVKLTVPSISLEMSEHSTEKQLERTMAPCAWLERGGFFNTPKYYGQPGPFAQRRQICPRNGQCPMAWLSYQDTQALTFRLIGTDDMRDYEFQAHFCFSIYDMHHRYCRGEENEIAFELRQTGTWLLLDRINCRCLGVAEVERYSYSKGVLPNDRVFRGNYLQMTCSKRPVCQDDDFCYVETPSTDGYIYGGRVSCICPKDHFCPVYFIRDKRVPQLNEAGRVISYGLRCKRRMY